MALAVFQRPGSNALQTAKSIIATMDVLSKRFPPGIKHTIVYNPTEFIQQSVNAVEETIVRVLGLGGMGTVFVCEHIQLKKRMALKEETPLSRVLDLRILREVQKGL